MFLIIKIIKNILLYLYSYIDLLKKYKGREYEQQIQDYLTINYLDYQSYLWKNIPFKYIIKYVFDDLKKYDIENIDNNNIISTVDNIIIINFFHIIFFQIIKNIFNNIFKWYIFP